MDTDAKSGQIFLARPVFGNALSETSKGEDKSWPQLLSPSSWRLRAHGHSLPPRGAKDSRSPGRRRVKRNFLQESVTPPLCGNEPVLQQIPRDRRSAASNAWCPTACHSRGAPAANLQGITREFKYTSSIVYPSALTALATLGSFNCKPCAFFHSSGMPSLALSTGGSPAA